MQKHRAIKLQALTEEICRNFSRPDRAHNNGETFSFVKHTVINDDVCALLFRKQPSRKFALAYAYWVNSGAGGWRYFFPGYTHVAGMAEFADLLRKVEDQNWDKNFTLRKHPYCAPVDQTNEEWLAAYDAPPEI